MVTLSSDMSGRVSNENESKLEIVCRIQIRLNMLKMGCQTLHQVWFLLLRGYFGGMVARREL